MLTRNDLLEKIKNSWAGVDLNQEEINSIIDIFMSECKFYMIQRNAIDYSAHTTVFPVIYATRELARQYIADHFAWFTLDKPIEPYFTILEVTPVESLAHPPMPPTNAKH